jgi:phosphoglycolate phosphatase
MKTILWDYNGTILDDAQLTLDVENTLLKERGMKGNYSMDAYRHLFCFPVLDYYRKLGYTFETESFEEVAEEFHRLYAASFSKCGCVDGVREKLAESKKKGYRNVIISASRQDKLEEQIESLGLRSYFADLIGIDNLLAGSKVGQAKAWMAETGTDPDTCHMIGDTLHDLETSMAIGVHDCTLVAQGHQAYDVLKDRWPNTVHTMREVVL